MNDKEAKMLRTAAGYRNQTATPGIMPFPGVARMYMHPQVSRRIATRTSYLRLPLQEKPEKVVTRVPALVLGIHNQPVFEMESVPVMIPKLDVDGNIVTDENGNPVEEQKIGGGMPVTIMRVKHSVVPVTKPARLDPRCPKGVYRSLKRLARKGVLPLAAVAATQLNKEVTK